MLFAWASECFLFIWITVDCMSVSKILPPCVQSSNHKASLKYAFLYPPHLEVWSGAGKYKLWPLKSLHVRNLEFCLGFLTLWEFTLFILTWLFGFLDLVAPAVKEIALSPAGLEIENIFLKEQQSKYIFFQWWNPFNPNHRFSSCRTWINIWEVRDGKKLNTLR